MSERAVATLKFWRLLRKHWCSTTRIKSLVQAVICLHLTSSHHMEPTWPPVQQTILSENRPTYQGLYVIPGPGTDCPFHLCTVEISPLREDYFAENASLCEVLQVTVVADVFVGLTTARVLSVGGTSVRELFLCVGN